MHDVTLKVTDGVAVVTLNRPAQKNAITGPLGEALALSVNTASDDPAVKVIMLCGAEGAFCSGLDLKAFNADPAPTWLGDFQPIWRGAHSALYNCKKPIIGALERYAINGGAALALACDLLITGEQAFLQVGEAKIGMAAPYNLAWLSLRYSENTMAQIALVGDRLTGKQLSNLGLAHQVVADDQVLNAALNLARELAAYPGDGLQRIKAGLRARISHSADEWFDQFTQPDASGASPKPSSMKST